MDQRKIASDVSRETGVHVEPNDPAFVTARLVQIVLEDTVARMDSDVRARLGEFECSIQRVEAKAGHMIAQRVKEAAMEFDTHLGRDLEATRLNINELVRDVQSSRRRLVTLIGAGIVGALLCFGGGLWIGTQCLR